MKKIRLSTLLLLVLTLLCSIFILTSCGGNDHTHSYSTEWAKDGTYHWQACAGCEETRNKAEHDWNSGIVTLQATNTSEGARTYTCNTCGQTRLERIPALDVHEHTFSESWSSNETHHWYSATCEHTDEKKDYNGHSWNLGEITTSPTETDEGVKTFTCLTCSKTRTESVPALGDSHTNKNDNTTWETKNDTIYVLTDCNIRSSASTISSKLGTAKLGDSFQRVESNGKWSKITYNNGTAYILNALITESAKRVTFDDKTAENKILHLKTDSSSYLRKSPVATEEANNIAGVIKDTHTAADTLKLVGLSQDGVWAKVSFTGNLGTDTNPQNFDGTEVLYIHVGNIVEFSTSGGGQLPG